MSKEKEPIFKIYMSHSIRGKDGDKATQETVDKNCLAAIKAGEHLRSYFLDWYRMDGFPEIELYIPAEGDEFVQIAHDKKMIDIDQILDVDCEILNRRHMLLVWGKYVSGGMEVEIAHAADKNIPIFACRTFSKPVIQDLKNVISIIITNELNDIEGMQNG